MEKYSLAIRNKNSSDFKVITWNDFEQVMRRDKVQEAFIFISADDLSEENWAKHAILCYAMLAKQGIKHYGKYCLVDHEDNDRLMPCIVLLDVDVKDAMVKAVLFRENKSMIQCVIFSNDDRFNVKEYELIRFDKRFNSQVN